MKCLKPAFRDDAMSTTQSFKWHSHFKRSQTSVEDFKVSSRPSSSGTDKNVEKVRQSSTETDGYN
jgi:hypothetical protein